jgi:hypothetical protein
MTGLGDAVENALQIVGITPEGVEDWLGRPCGCEERKEKLNQLSAWASRICKGKLDKAKEYLSNILEEERK